MRFNNHRKLHKPFVLLQVWHGLLGRSTLIPPDVYTVDAAVRQHTDRDPVYFISPYAATNYARKGGGLNGRGEQQYVLPALNIDCLTPGEKRILAKIVGEAIERSAGAMPVFVTEAHPRSSAYVLARLSGADRYVAGALENNVPYLMSPMADRSPTRAVRLPNIDESAPAVW